MSKEMKGLKSISIYKLQLYFHIHFQLYRSEISHALYGLPSIFLMNFIISIISISISISIYQYLKMITSLSTYLQKTQNKWIICSPSHKIL
jgi:hypothetical protein